MLAIKIDNPEIESRFKEYAAQQKKAIEDVVSDAMRLFLDMHKKNDELIYVKKDPILKHIQSKKTTFKVVKRYKDKPTVYKSFKTLAEAQQFRDNLINQTPQEQPVAL